MKIIRCNLVMTREEARRVVKELTLKLRNLENPIEIALMTELKIEQEEPSDEPESD